MDLDGLTWLLTPTGQTLLASLYADDGLTEATMLRYITRLRKQHPAAGVAAAIETALLRRAARTKFPHAGHMYFTREALEQATPYPVAAYRAARFANCQQVADLACSIGGDALPLAQRTHVLAVDRDPLRLALLRANADALGLGERITTLQADIATVDLPACDGIFFDPARRRNGRRIRRVEQYEPPLSTLQRWDAPLRAAKVAPGVDAAEIPPDCEAEFVSLDGDLREACFWWGTDWSGLRRATLLRAEAEPITLLANPATSPAPLSPPLRYLYEPDAAIIRAHAVADVAAMIGAAQFDRDIAYLTSDRYVESPWVRGWEIEASLPFQLKALRHTLRERNIGSVTVKKRGSPIEPDDLRRQLRLSGDAHQLLVLTQVNDAPTVLLCGPVLTETSP